MDNVLYKIWSTIDEIKREEILEKICLVLKNKNIEGKNEDYNWFNIIKEKNVLNDKELEIIKKSYKNFDKYLYDVNFTLIYNNLTFDDIIYNNNDIKINSNVEEIYAPKDYQLNYIYLMIKDPNEFNERQKIEDYKRVFLYIRKYYPEIVDIKYLYKRLSIYNLIYYMDKFINNDEYKEKVLKEAKFLLVKNNRFEDLKTPEDLYLFIDNNIEFGWIDRFNNKHYNNLKDLRKNYLIASVEDVLKYHLGLCIEQVKLAKYFFDINNIENRVYCARIFEDREYLNKDIKLHCFILYKLDGYWYYIENANSNKKGIYKFNSIKEALNFCMKDYEDRNEDRKLTEIKYIPDKITYYEFNRFVNEYDK